MEFLSLSDTLTQIIFISIFAPRNNIRIESYSLWITLNQFTYIFLDQNYLNCERKTRSSLQTFAYLILYS
jgi:hypothetical protein